ncbi:hypothetical protein QBC44DRAFT_364632 [Cladorrhinum sp. PSN332]|nr:hypothetical protein QBC44DRAFT_364632 [Cladorrhinum sp. PSN332]
MIPTTTLLLTLAAGLTTASPLLPRAGGPPKSQASAFSLIANVTDTAKAATLFGPYIPVHNTYITFVHSDSGFHPASLHTVTRSAFFVNGTAQDVSSASTSINMPPIEQNNRFAPQGLQFLPDGSVGLQVGFPTTGAGIRGGLRSAYPVAFGPGSGQFVVCNEAATGGLTRAVKYIEGEEAENCLGIKLLAYCTGFPEGTIKDEAKAALKLEVQNVDCY